MPQAEPPHDILAAEAFALPAPDPRLHHRDLRLPEDPTGIAEPHDVLAAEMFALPAVTVPGAAAGGHSEDRHRALRLVAGAGAALLAARVVRHRSRGA